MTEGGHNAFCSYTGGESMWGSDGLTKREYFAAMAMQGALANPEVSTLVQKATWNPATGDIISPSKSAQEQIAEASVKQADALIAALNQEAK